MKSLNLKETALKEEIKEILEELENMYEISELEEQVNNINKIRDYIINLQQENKQLKDNWNELKEYISIKLYNTEYLQKLCGFRIDDIDYILLDVIREEMQELEQGSDSNE